MHRHHFYIRIREKQSAFKNHCLNCFVSFTQTRDATTRRGFSQRSIVLVCKHPFSTLAFKILRRLSVVIDNLPPKSSSPLTNTSSVTREQYEANVSVVVEVSFEHFLSWPHPTAGTELQLPFYGDVFDFTVPPLMTYVDTGVEPEDTDKYMDTSADKEESHYGSGIPRALSVSVSRGSGAARQEDGLGGGAGLFADDNLVALLRPLGLLPHLWTLWELVVTGRDILVWAPSPELASRVVTALVSLAAPLAYGGDFRPYITPYDSDVALLAAASSKTREWNDAQCAATAGSSMMGAVSLMGCSTEVVMPPSSFGSDSSSLIFEAIESFYDMTGQGGAGGRVGTLDTVLSSDGMDDLRDVAVEYVSAQPSGPNTARGRESLLPEGGSPPNMFARAISGGVPAGKCRSGGCLGTCVTTSTYADGQKPPSMIVGITNPFLLKAFCHFDSCVFLPLYDIPQEDSSPLKAGEGKVHEPPSPFSAVRSQRQSLFSSRSTSREMSVHPESSTRSVNSQGHEAGKIPFVDSPPSPPEGACTPPKSSASAPAADFPCNVNRIATTTSLESVFDKWMASGGAGTAVSGSKNTMLVLRSPVSVKPDSRILQLLNSACMEENLSSQQQPLAGLFSSGSARYSPCSEGAEAEKERRDIQANMLIREHFRQLTCWLMKPFEAHFQARSDLERSLAGASSGPWPSRGGTSPVISTGAPTPVGVEGSIELEVSTSSDEPTFGPASSANHMRSRLSLEIAAQQQSPHRRRGASSLWLYRNPVELLGGDSIGASIRKYRKSGKHIPECFLPARRQELFTAFAESDTFQNYYRWRKRNLTAQMMMEMALACCSLSGEELIEQFAIEKGSDVVTQMQMKELEARINMYIRALSIVQSNPVQTSWLIDKMKDHLITISQLW